MGVAAHLRGSRLVPKKAKAAFPWEKRPRYSFHTWWTSYSYSNTLNPLRQGNNRRVGPYGEVACVNSDGDTVAYFDPAKVLLALDCYLRKDDSNGSHGSPL